MTRLRCSIAVWVLVATAVGAVLTGCGGESAALPDETRATQFVEAVINGDSERAMSLGSVPEEQFKSAQVVLLDKFGGRPSHWETEAAEPLPDGRQRVEMKLSTDSGESVTVRVDMVAGTGMVDSIEVIE